MSLENPNIEKKNKKEDVKIGRRDFFRFLSGKNKDDLNKPNAEELDSNNQKAKKINRRLFIESGLAAATGAVIGTEIGGYDKFMQIVRQSWESKENLSSIAKVIRVLKDKFPNVNQGINDEEYWAESIKNACLKEGLEKTNENIALILTIIYTESKFRIFPRLQDNLAFPKEDSLRYVGVEPSTGGPMGKSYDVLSKELKISKEEAKEKIDTLEGGIFYGVKYLKEILSSYSVVNMPQDKKIECIFADYNAGIDSSKRAGLQHVLNELYNSSLKEDGLLREKVAEELKKITEQERKNKIIYENLIPNNAEIDSGLKQMREKMINTVISPGRGNYEGKKLWHFIEILNKNIIKPIPANMQNLKFGHNLLLEPNDSREYAKESYKNYLMIQTLL